MQTLKTALFFKLNFFVTTLFFLAFALFYEKARLYYFVLPAAISTAAMLYLIYYLLLRPFFRFSRVMLPLLAALFTLTDYVLLFDFFLYRLWKFHINAMVLNILLSPASWDSIQFGTAPVVVTLFYFIFMFFLQHALIRFVEKNSERLKRYNRLFNRTVAPIVLILALWEKLYYGYANMKSRRSILESVASIPLYQPFTYTRFAHKYLGIEVVEANATRFGVDKEAKVRYPLQELEIRKPNPVPIFIFGADAVRADMLTPKIMPNLYDFAQEATVYTDARSGGNCTRFGLFSFFYGLNAPYWFAFLHAGRGPVLFDILKKLNYQIGIFSSTDTRWPEFRQTIYYNVQDRIVDQMPGKPWQKDRSLADKWMGWLDRADINRPLFTFLFFDAPHGRSYPDNQTPFLPDGGGTTDYTTASAKDRTILFNQYKNAVHYDDALFGKLLEKLKTTGLYERSVIVFMADHGEEFFEHGHFSHNNAFDKEQTNALLIVKLPGQKPGIVRKLASHMDVVPSLLRYIGVTTPLTRFSNAVYMFTPDSHRTFVTSGNWYHSAIITPSTTYVFSNLPNAVLGKKIYDNRTWKPLDRDPNPDTGKFIMKVLHENRAFIR